MDEQTRTQIVLAAITATGAKADDEELADWQARVTDMAARITAMSHERSTLSQTIESVSRSKVFTATVVGIDKEESSTRGIVHLRTKPSQHHPDGVETARTERTDNPVGLAMARRLKSLIGHRVAIWIEVEEINGGTNKVRVVRHVDDLGVDASAGHSAA